MTQCVYQTEKQDCKLIEVLGKDGQLLRLKGCPVAKKYEALLWAAIRSCKGEEPKPATLVITEKEKDGHISAPELQGV